MSITLLQKNRKSADFNITEGFNNKIRWLIRLAYGFRDLFYLKLKEGSNGNFWRLHLENDT